MNKLTDFNDMAKLLGLDAVKLAIESAIPVSELTSLSGVPDHLPDDLQEESQQNNILDIVEEVNKAHAVIFSAGQTLILTEYANDKGKKDIKFGRLADVRQLYANQFVSITNKAGVTSSVCVIDVWMRAPNRRTYTGGIVFEPDGASDDCYNLFQGFSVQPVNGDCSLFLKHALENICQGNQEFYDYLMGWLAHMMQHPGVLPEVAIVLTGEEGVGKGVFVSCVGKLLEPHFIVVASMEQLLGRFAAHLMGKVLVYVNEAIWGGNKASEGLFKAMITDRDETVEEKFKSPIRVRNCKHFMLSSNDDWPVAIGKDSRRYFALKVGSKRKEDNVYFDAIAKQMRYGGSEALMYELMNRDLSAFNVRKFPQTPFNFDIKLLSMDSSEQFIYEYLRDSFDEDSGGKLVQKADLHKWYLQWCQDHGKKHPHIDSVFGKHLKRLLPSISETKGTFKSSLGPYRAPCYLFQCGSTCRSEFAKACKAGTEIWEPL